MVAGYFGGFVDDVLMRVVDIFMGVPTLPFAIVVVTVNFIIDMLYAALDPRIKYGD